MTFASKLIKGGLMMRKQIKNIITILGGVIVMTNLSGCSEANAANNPATSSSINQREARAVEAQFEPLFQFLAEEKKDFSKLKRYYSSYSIFRKGDNSAGVYEEYTIRFDELETSNEGSYIVTKAGEVTIYPVSFNPGLGRIEGQDLYFPFIVPQILNSDVLKSYPVTSYLANHPKTELSTISYEIDDKFPLLQEVVAQMRLQDISAEDISLDRRGNKEYSYAIWFSDNQFRYGLDVLIEFK